MNDKSKLSSELTAIGSIVSKNAVKLLPGGGFLTDFWQARKEQIAKSMQANGDRRLGLFCEALLRAPMPMDEVALDALLEEADFQALLKACVADIEEEKAPIYAQLVRSLAIGRVTDDHRRHFILSLRDLSLEELGRLRKALVAKEHELTPKHGGSGRMAQEAFIGTGKPGSFQSIHAGNLAARGYVHEGALSDLGVEFAKAVWQDYELTPQSLDFTTWKTHNVAILNYDDDQNRHLGAIAADITDRLRAIRCRSSVVAATGSNIEDLQRSATHAILLLGHNSRFHIAAHLEALHRFARIRPPVVVQTLKSAEFVEGLQVLDVVRFDDGENIAQRAVDTLTRFLGEGASA